MKCGHCLVVDSLNEHSCPAQANIVSIQRMAAVRRRPGVVCGYGTESGILESNEVDLKFQ